VKGTLEEKCVFQNRDESRMFQREETGGHKQNGRKKPMIYVGMQLYRADMVEEE
jgi:hypothetical protein